MACYTYARGKFKVPIPNGVYEAGGGGLMPKEARKDDVREMAVKGSMVALPYPPRGKRPNRAKRHRLNYMRRSVAANRAAR